LVGAHTHTHTHEDTVFARISLLADTVFARISLLADTVFARISLLAVYNASLYFLIVQKSPVPKGTRDILPWYHPFLIVL